MSIVDSKFTIPTYTNKQNQHKSIYGARMKRPKIPNNNDQAYSNTRAAQNSLKEPYQQYIYIDHKIQDTEQQNVTAHRTSRCTEP
jgi:hypothetical protein